MNRFLDSRYAETVERLALGLEPIDGGRRGRVAHAVAITLDGVPRPLSRPERRARTERVTVVHPRRETVAGTGLADVLVRIPRHDSCVHAIVHGPATDSPIDIRIVDPSRRFVPRRLRIPVPTRAQIESAELGTAPISAAPRVRRPVLFPGAAYDVSESATAVRGRVRLADRPLRWARVEARRATGPQPGPLLGRAHGDDRGEFLLVLGENPGDVGPLVSPLAVRVTVTAPDPVPVPASPSLPHDDPLWDLPLEPVPAAAAADPVAEGTQPPPGYDPGRTVSRTIDLPLGRIASESEPFVVV